VGAGAALNLTWMLIVGLAIVIVTLAVVVWSMLRRLGGPFSLSIDFRSDRERSLRVPIQPVTEVDPTAVGIDRPAPEVAGGQLLHRYLPREVDADLRAAVRSALNSSGPWMVVATGSSKVGKSRALFEALLHCSRSAELELIAPVDAEAVLSLTQDETPGGTRSVLWLDDLEPFLAQGLTLHALRQWQAGPGVRIVAATYSGKIGDLTRRSAAAAPLTIAAEMLEQAVQVRVGRTTRTELEPLRSELTDDALATIEQHGLAAYLVAAPALVRKLETGRHTPTEPECPEGRAVVLAAVDWVRCGRRDPIPVATLRELWPSYLRAELHETAEGFETGLEWALRGVAGTIALLLQEEEGYRAYDYAVQSVEDMIGRPPEDAAWVRAIEGANDTQALSVGASAYLHGSFRNALTAFKVASNSPSAEVAASAAFNLGTTLSQLERFDEAISVSDEVLARFGDDPALGEQTAGAMVNKGTALTGMGRQGEAIDAYDQALRRLGSASEAGLREQVAKASVGKAIALSEIGETDRAIALYDEVLERFGQARESALREVVAGALFNKGAILVNVGRVEEAVALYDEMQYRFDGAPEPGLRDALARALGSKGVALARLGHQDEAIVAYQEVVARYGETGDPGLRRLAARALYSSGLMLATLGREQEAIATFEDVGARYGDSSDPELRELVEDAHTGRSLAQGTLKRSDGVNAGDAEVLERANAAEARRLEADFERNLREPVRITELRVNGLEVFTDMSWGFHPSVNLLLGRNGYGKSLLLRIVAGMLQRDPDVTSELFDLRRSDSEIELGLVRNEIPAMIERNRSVFGRASLGKVPLLAIPDTRVMDRSTTTVSEPDSLNLATNGATHFLAQQPYQSAVEALLSGLVIDYWEHGKSFDLPTFALINDVLRRLADQSFEFRRIERVGRTGSRIWVRTEGLDRELEIQRASQGTLSVITMFGQVHSFLQEVAAARGVDDPEEVRNQEAIVLIDEVDAHLHPVWQQKIRNALVETFPQVQFLLTAHSPLVVAGCGPGEVSVLRRSPEGYRIQQLQKDFVGVPVQQLYSEIFDIEDLDETFLEYARWKATGAEAQIEGQLEALFEKERDGELSGEDVALSKRLLLDSRRISRVEEVNAQRQDVEMEVLEREAEISRLRAELERSQASGGGSGS
jgi:tetratricopeptide (TPR) repeat protein